MTEGAVDWGRVVVVLPGVLQVRRQHLVPGRGAVQRVPHALLLEGPTVNRSEYGTLWLYLAHVEAAMPAEADDGDEGDEAHDAQSDQREVEDAAVRVLKPDIAWKMRR